MKHKIILILMAAEIAIVVPVSAVLLHRYSFDGPAGSTTITDSVGNANGTLINGSATATLTGSGQLTLDGNVSKAWVHLPSGIMPQLTNAIFETWVQDNDPNSDWAELWTFGTNNGTVGIQFLTLVPNSAADGVIRLDDSQGLLLAPEPLPYTNMVCLTVSYNLNAQRASVYLNGQKVASGTVSLPLYTIPDPDNYLGQSQWYGSGDPYFNGVLDEFRIYSGTESDLQIAIDAAAGPNNIVTNAGAFISIQFNNSTNVLVNGEFLPGVLANYSLLTNMVNIGTVSGITYSSDNTNVLAYETDGYFHAVGVGTTTIRASYQSLAEALTVTVMPQTVIQAKPLNVGRIDPKLFGNFIELLEDLVPGMRAEMLNDRSFEGVTRAANWSYYDGSLDICDRKWDPNPTWTYDVQNPFNGARSVKVTATPTRAGTLTQSGLAVKRGIDYIFTGYFRTDHPNLKATVLLKVRLPSGEWLTLCSAPLSALSGQWQKRSVRMTSAGATDGVVFESRVEGEGHLWADQLSLMPADNVLGWRRDVVAAIKEVHPSIVRWGGSAVDPGEYRWKDGIGDQDRRVPFPNKNWGRIDSNDVGMDEFCQFCELVGAEPLICVSFSDGPQSAADLVEYCNDSAQTVWGARRVANGHAAPYRVKYWQIGNEISGDDTNYLNEIGQFAQLMKAADSGIGILSSFPTQKLLDKAGKELDYIAPHHYTPDLEKCDQDFKNLGRMIDQTPGCHHLKIAVTEWNIDGGAWGLGRAKQKTLMGALMNAGYLNLLMRHCDKVEIACRSDMANAYCCGTIETSPNGFGVLKRPSYYVMQLYARHAKPIPLTLNQPKEGPDLFACESSDKTSLVIFAVNVKQEPIKWSFGFEGFSGAVRMVSAESVCDVLNEGQPDIMNHWNAPERVKIVELSPEGNGITLPPLSATALECKVK